MKKLSKIILLTLLLPFIANASLQEKNNLNLFDNEYKLLATKGEKKVYLNMNNFSTNPNDKSLINVWLKITYPPMYPQDATLNNDTTMVKVAISCKEKGLYMTQLIQYLNKKQTGPTINIPKFGQILKKPNDNFSENLVNYVCNNQLKNNKGNYKQTLVNS